MESGKLFKNNLLEKWTIVCKFFLVASRPMLKIIFHF